MDDTLRAGIGTRFVAALIDVALLGAGALLLSIVLNKGAVAAIASVAAIAYSAHYEAQPDGQTIGKRVMGIRVVDALSLGTLEPRQAVVRAVMRYISGAAASVGFVWAIFDRETRTWHDFAAQTVVVPTEE